MRDPAIQEWLHAREVLRRLGFTPDELFFTLVTSGVIDRDTGNVVVERGVPVIALTIRAQGLEFQWTIARTELPKDEVQAAYERACEEWNTSTPDIDREVDELRASRPYSMRIQLAQALAAKGFMLRRPEVR